VEPANYSARLMSTKKIRIVAATALAAGLALAATPASARTAAPKGSCKLLTAREAGRILGTPAGSTKRTSNARADSCTWNAKKKGTGGLKGQPLGLEITVATGQAGVEAYQNAKARQPDENEPVPGLGDEAFIRSLDLAILSGSTAMVVELHNYRYPKPLTQEQIKQKQIDAATIALGRLPAS
jgi:hypothetical protein